jgi:GNAT superfamily N-acetyltransferase
VDKAVAVNRVTIRDYREEDAQEVGQLIADVYSVFNLDFAPPEELGPLLGPFQYARSPEKVHQQAIARVIRSEMVFVAEEAGEIVGVLRGRKERLASLFVRGDRHRQGIGRRLVERFEQECRDQGVAVIRVAATLYAVPFYLALGYKRSTGVRSGWSFEGRGLRYQPMKKILARAASSLAQARVYGPPCAVTLLPRSSVGDHPITLTIPHLRG